MKITNLILAYITITIITFGIISTVINISYKPTEQENYIQCNVKEINPPIVILECKSKSIIEREYEKDYEKIKRK